MWKMSLYHGERERDREREREREREISNTIMNNMIMTSQVGTHFYPETMWKIYLVNTPMLFRAVWTVVKPWLHPITAAKVIFLFLPSKLFITLNPKF
jgi:hypothetical protein